MEILKVYCEVILNRIDLFDLKPLDVSLQEPVHSLLFATNHLSGDLKELKIIKDILSEFVPKNATSFHFANQRVTSLLRLTVGFNDPAVLEKYLELLWNEFKLEKSSGVSLEELKKGVIRNYASGSNGSGGAGEIEYVDEQELAERVKREKEAQSRRAEPKYDHIPVTSANTARTTSSPVAPPSNIATTTSHATFSPSPPISTGSSSFKIPELPSFSPEKETFHKPNVDETGTRLMAAAPHFPPVATHRIENEDDAPDFDELAKRFEELKRSK
jgi:hypothetical protein